MSGGCKIGSAATYPAFWYVSWRGALVQKYARHPVLRAQAPQGAHLLAADAAQLLQTIRWQGSCSLGLLLDGHEWLQQRRLQSRAMHDSFRTRLLHV